MARTHGHGNPSWSRDETVLALDLYNQVNGKPLSRSDPRVQALSVLLRNLPRSGNRAGNETYRNPDSVAFKLLNIGAVATGKGLKNVSAMDRAVWREFGSDSRRVRRIADLIRKGTTILNSSNEEIGEDENEEFLEGRTLTLLHKTRERNRKLRQRLLAKRRKVGPLVCDLCAFTPLLANQKFIDAAFEAHHLIPISQSFKVAIRLSDLALLCATCHRLIHRAIALEGRWLPLSDARRILGIGSGLTSRTLVQ